MNQLKKQKEVLKLIRGENISVCAVIETHLKPDKLAEASNRCFGGWDWVSNSVHSQNSCRIVIGWDRNVVNVMILHMSRQTIFCLIESVDKNIKLYCNFIYAANCGIERRVLWNEIRTAANVVADKPWIMLGDFNVIMKADEHSSGSSLLTNDMQEFIECVNDVEMEDINSFRLFFTWIKSPAKPETSIMKKLDRILVNGSFMNYFKDAHGHFMPFLISDHSAAVLTFPKSLVKKRKSFRFSNFIVEKKEFLPTVEKEWKKDVKGYAMYKVVKKLKTLKHPMKKLSWKNGDLTAEWIYAEKT
ncbi:RNA-directed DNA polymerase, eukaryota, reverse transcriptase zinc-binding domain protein [Tanacetum coccineum]